MQYLWVGKVARNKQRGLVDEGFSHPNEKFDPNQRIGSLMQKSFEKSVCFQGKRSGKDFFLNVAIK